mmetsp:Transcript_31796/g.83108  ORF Transcript_31796/g.83108 Transcript_31796/m.83108 type:complete len:271 (+) Transcript_31796:626-1438(+)
MRRRPLTHACARKSRKPCSPDHAAVKAICSCSPDRCADAHDSGGRSGLFTITCYTCMSISRHDLARFVRLATSSRPWLCHAAGARILAAPIPSIGVTPRLLARTHKSLLARTLTHACFSEQPFRVHCVILPPRRSSLPLSCLYHRPSFDTHPPHILPILHGNQCDASDRQTCMYHAIRRLPHSTLRSCCHRLGDVPEGGLDRAQIGCPNVHPLVHTFLCSVNQPMDFSKVHFVAQGDHCKIQKRRAMQESHGFFHMAWCAVGVRTIRERN